MRLYSSTLVVAGFSVTAYARLTELESSFIKAPSADLARANLKHITSKEHMAGTAGDLEMAKFVRDQFESFGLDASIEPVRTMLSYPSERKAPSLKLLRKADRSVVFEAALSEEILPSDPTSDTWLRNHTYNGYSPSGDVIGDLVYANYGTPDDFAALDALGVDVSGKIVITRYGKCFRGLKAMNAQRRGAIGVLIYTDPADDGYARGDTYPDGPWRPAFGVQRGSVQFLSLCPGDPVRTEGPYTVEQMCGYHMDEVIPQIPTLPISYGDAKPLLEALAGPVAPKDFQGALNITYHTGPSDVGLVVRLTTHNEFTVTPIWNVIGVVPSHKYGTADDRVIVIGNHRDAWVYGAVDPNSGTAVQLEVARGLGQLVKCGWRPQRTIVLASWSGEEMALLGSTAWGEANAEWLSEQAVAYVNVDSGVSGKCFKGNGTPSLWSLLKEVAADILDPETGRPMGDLWPVDPHIIGSGSDYTVFLDHLGIASLDLASQIDPIAPYGVYHSIYDSFSWMEQWGDPTFRYHVEMAQYWGVLTLRLSEAQVLPMNHTTEAEALSGFVKQLHSKLNDKGAQAKVDLRPLQEAVEYFQVAADLVEEEIVRAVSHALYDPGQASLSELSSLNDRLSFTERRFLSPAGLPHRKYFKSIKQAPGLYLGYGAESFPGVTQAISDGEWEVAQEQANVAAKRVMAAAAYLSGKEEEQEGG